MSLKVLTNTEVQGCVCECVINVHMFPLVFRSVANMCMRWRRAQTIIYISIFFIWIKPFLRGAGDNYLSWSEKGTRSHWAAICQFGSPHLHPVQQSLTLGGETRHTAHIPSIPVRAVIIIIVMEELTGGKCAVMTGIFPAARRQSECSSQLSSAWCLKEQHSDCGKGSGNSQKRSHSKVWRCTNGHYPNNIFSCLWDPIQGN